ncbi:hypothetical protein FACS1894180_0660 [Bacteroidia bacterium]|nr:hypothetical protein FACS1894178_7760 [Bacteroidia bacterium]GHV42952.1 hypothetical protein FACS1894180_0660 [Bacteroidia bacterium]
MKKTPLLIAFLLFAASTWSQSVAILDVNGNDISGTTIDIPISAGMYEAAYSIKIKNLTDSPISLKITKVYDEGPVAGSDNTMCSPSTAAGFGYCYQSGTLVTAPFTLAVDEISGNAEMHYEPGVNSGTTTIRYKVQNTTDATDFAFVTLSFSTTSAVLPKEAEFFSVYPNPASDYIVIDGNKMAGNGEELLVEIFDITGKQLSTTSYKCSTKMDISQLKSGIYFCRFSGSDIGGKVVKLLVQ